MIVDYMLAFSVYDPQVRVFYIPDIQHK
ncbi:uncharacterized protein METZ01_LOCUS234504 [marine metagenome]|uniref:Uncharacterized protein n=1 Tax=marine metagenome TaxID=408172 RepID=A0A382H310_9ZZZZ